MNEHIIFKIGGDATAFEKSLAAANNQASAIQSRFASFSKIVFGGAIATAATSVVSYFRDIAKAQQDLQHQSELTGLSVATLGQLAKALKLDGEEAVLANKALLTFTKAVDDAREGGAGALANFEKLGITLKNQSGEYKTTEELLADVKRALDEVGGGAEKGAALFALFGKNAVQFTQALSRIKELTGADKANALFTSQLTEEGANGLSVPRLLNTIGKKIAFGFGAGRMGAEALWTGLVTGTNPNKIFKQIEAERRGAAEASIKQAEDEDRAAAAALEKKRIAAAVTKTNAELEKTYQEGRRAALTTEERQVELADEMAAIQDELSKAGDDEIKRAEKRLELQKKQNEYAELEKKRLEDVGRQVDKIAEAFNAANRASADLSTAREDARRLSLSDLANMGSDGTRLTRRAMMVRNLALDVQNSEWNAQEAQLQGDTAGAKWFQEQALSGRKRLGDLGVLTSGEADPFKSMVGQLKEANEKLDAGLKVFPVLGNED